MKKLIFSLLSVLITALAFAQDGNGIHFEKTSWAQVQQLAKQENKYIFLDCYATWCGPCKVMDRDVYVNDQVGAFYNKNFISVSVQIDSTAKDDEFVQSWRADANDLQKRYRITALPTFLFFSPEGKLVHRAEGAKNVDKFIALGKDAIDPQHQLYSLFQNFKEGKLSVTDFPTAIAIARKSGELEIADTLNTFYVKQYIYKLPLDQMLTRQSMEYIPFAIKSSKDKGFMLFYKYPEQAEAASRKGLSASMIDYIVNIEDIKPALYGPKHQPIRENPDWVSIENNIARKYTKAIAERNILNAQIGWYQERQDWKNLIDKQVYKIEKNGVDTVGIGWAIGTNNLCYYVILKHSSDKTILLKAANWMAYGLQAHPDDYESLDTRANLLYKAGYKKEAIDIETKVITMAEIAAKKLKTQPDPLFQQTLDKMRKGEPTWID